MAAVGVVGIILTFCTALGASAARADSARLTRDNRDVLVVSELSTHAIEKYRWFYQQAEEFSIRKAYELLGGTYRHVYVLTGEKATFASFKEALSKLAARSSEGALDVIIELHGSPGELVFREGGYPVEKIRDGLRADSRLATKLRALYSGACYGATHIDSFLAAGFKVASGSRKVNTNGMYDYPAFLKAWRDGDTFGAAQDKGNDPYWRGVFDRLAYSMGFNDTDSFKEVRGAKEMTISAAPGERHGAAAFYSLPTSTDTEDVTVDTEESPRVFARALAELKDSGKRSVLLDEFEDFMAPARAGEGLSPDELPADESGLVTMTPELSERLRPTRDARERFDALMDEAL